MNVKHRKVKKYVGYTKKKALDFSKAFCGSRGSRTPDPLLVRQML